MKDKSLSKCVSLQRKRTWWLVLTAPSMFEIERTRGPVANNLATGPIVFNFNGPCRPTEENHCF